MKHKRSQRGRRQFRHSPYEYDAAAFPASNGAATIMCVRGCGRRMVVALLSSETANTARRICETCAADRAARLTVTHRRGDDMTVVFGRAVQRLAEQLGVAQGTETLRRYPEVRS